MITPRRSSPSPSLLFPLVVIFLDALGAGLALPVIPTILEEFSVGPSSDEAVAMYYGIFVTIYAGAQFIGGPIIGALSDRFGRRPVLLVSSVSSGLDHLLVAVAPDLAWLFIGRVLSGLSAASYAAAMAYIADVSTPKTRGRNFGFVGATYAIGLVIGPAVGGVTGALDPRLPLWLAAGLGLVSLAWGWFVLEESLPKSERRPLELRRANPLVTLRVFGRTSSLVFLGVVLVLTLLPQRALDGLWVLYMELRLGWNTSQVGVALTLAALAMGLAQGLLAGPIIRRLTERWTIAAGLLLMTVSCVGFGFATQAWQFYLWLIPFALGGVHIPALASTLAGTVATSEQGELQGAIGSVRGLAAIVGPLIGAAVFAQTLHVEAWEHAPGAVYYAVAAPLFAVALGVYLRGRRPDVPKTVPTQSEQMP